MPGYGGSSYGYGGGSGGGSSGGGPSVLGAVAGPAAGLAGGAISYFGNKSAQKAQERAQQRAENYQRERDAIEDRRYEEETARRAEQDAFARQQWEADAPSRLARASVAAKYGIQVPYNVVSGLGGLMSQEPQKFGSRPIGPSRGPMTWGGSLRNLVDTVE